MSASRWRDERGLTLPIVAIMITTIILMVSFAVDLGRQRADRRLAQAGADVVALDMMRVVDGRTLQEVDLDGGTVTALNASAMRNGFTNTWRNPGTTDDRLPRITLLEWGVIVPGQDGDTFEALSTTGGDGDQDGEVDLTQSPNAVKITAERTTDFFFQPDDRGVTRTAIAALPLPNVDLKIGSVAAGFDPSYPIASATLSATVVVLNRSLHRQFNATTPTPSTAFDLVGYRGLANADVELWRVAANAGFASPNDMLNSSMTAGQFFDATASALDQQAAEGDPNAANAAAELRRFRTGMGVDSTGQMDMGDAVHYAQGGDDAAAEGSVNVLDLLRGSANVINGANFVSYSFTTDIPFPTGGQFVTVDVTQHIVEPETTEENLPINGVATNTQARFQVNIHVAPLTGMVSTAPVTIPLVVEAATATGVVDRMDCADPVSASEAEIDVTTSGVSVRLGTATDLTAGTVVVTPGVVVQSAASFGSSLLNANVLLALGLSPLQILGYNLTGALTATSSASVLGGFSEHTFLAIPDDPGVPYQRAPGGLGSATIGSQLSSNLAASVGATALTATAMTALRSQLSYAFNNLQGSILNPILQQAGVAIAGADLKAYNMDCDGAGLKLVG
jgi:tight adherence protein G